jgi:endonuclease G
MTPQYGSLNRGDWKILEMKTREWAKAQDSIKIWTGSVGEAKKVGRLSIPEKCWKVLYIKSSNSWLAYIFQNDQSKPNGIEDNKVTIEEVEKLTNLKFKIK